ncbi:hypothetical protein [Streptomyces sp. NPDC058330]|uniref:hypothetical protein n=1 Tax=Streptomyces sp. NPDC058330 TaxID=3346449 RepID=UPI0036EA26C3
MSKALDFQFRDTDRRVRDTDRRVSDLDSRLDDLEGEHERLKSRFGYTEDLDHELRSLRDDISGLETTTEEVDGRADELDDRVKVAERTVKRLTQHVRLLEGQIMAVGNVPPADLDTFTKDQRALAARMESGWDAADVLLTSTRRTHHQNRVQRFHDAQARHQATREEAVALVGTLLSTPYNTQPHAKAATKLRSVIAREATERQGLARQASEARTSTAALVADRVATADKQPAIAGGQRGNNASPWRCAANWPTPSATACSCPPGSPPSSARPHQHETPNAGSSARPASCSTASPTTSTTRSSPSVPAPTPKTNTNIGGGRN